MVSAGKNLLLGLAEGIANAISAVVAKAKEACKKVVDSVKGAFGIHSPSKLFENVIGKNLMLGMAIGIDEESNTVEDSMADIAKKVADTDFDFDTSGILDNVDTDILYAKMEATVDTERTAFNGESQAKAESNHLFNNVDDDNKSNNDKPSNRLRLEGDVYLDSKPVGKVIAPVVAGEIEWRGK
ncbi:hypothetical protein SDC9_151943 [bioreactor metagenome]|uniref:Uncharacterized protein n=1 Tax=bioreactor metagenome TaxID=1076179 RepID=A0A645ERN2_9ZZZZ